MSRICSSCGSSTTYIDKHGYEHWYKDKCSRCHTNKWRQDNLEHTREYGRNYWRKNPDKLKEHNEKWNPIAHAQFGPRRIVYKNTRVYLDENPRKGKCSQCGNEGYTHMHHIEYHDDDPLKDTIELCPACHGNTITKNQ